MVEQGERKAGQAHRYGKASGQLKCLAVAATSRRLCATHAPCHDFLREMYWEQALPSPPLLFTCKLLFFASLFTTPLALLPLALLYRLTLQFLLRAFSCPFFPQA